MQNGFAPLKTKAPHAAPRLCERCGSPSLERQIATDPLDGRRVNVGRVELDRCRQGGHLRVCPRGVSQGEALCQSRKETLP